MHTSIRTHTQTIYIYIHGGKTACFFGCYWSALDLQSLELLNRVCPIILFPDALEILEGSPTYIRKPVRILTYISHYFCVGKIMDSPTHQPTPLRLTCFNWKMCVYFAICLTFSQEPNAPNTLWNWFRFRCCWESVAIRFIIFLWVDGCPEVLLSLFDTSVIKKTMVYPKKKNMWVRFLTDLCDLAKSLRPVRLTDPKVLAKRS